MRQEFLNKVKNPVLKDKLEATSNLFKIKEDQEVNWDLLRNILAFNMEEKKGYEKFWR